MVKEYLVSVAIPTYNRQKFAAIAIRQVYSLGSDVQVVIADNSDSNILFDTIRDIVDHERVKYIYTKEKLSVVENYDLAARHADG